MTRRDLPVRAETIEVCVVGRQPLLNQALAALISGLPGFKVVVGGPAPEPRLAVLVSAARPDAVALAELRHAHPGSGIVCLIAGCTPADAVAMLQIGAIACVSSEITADELAAAMRQAARGEVTLSADLAQQVIANLAGSEAPRPRGAQLTTREDEILQLVCQGLTNKEIGQRLYLSVRTVENHLLSIYTKLGVRTRTEAAVAALHARAAVKNS